MIEVLLVGVAAGVIGFLAGAGTGAVIASRRGGRGPALLPGPRPLAVGLRDVRKGGFVSIKAGAEDYKDVELTVERCDRFEAGRAEWTLLEGAHKDAPYALEWTDERGTLRVWRHVAPRKGALAQLSTAAQLGALTVGASIAENGVTYEVVAAGKAMRHENSLGFGKELSAWRLVSKDGKRTALIERQGDATTVSIGEQVDPNDIEVFKARA